MHATLYVALAAVAATLIGSFAVAPLIGRWLKRNQSPPVSKGTPVSVVIGDPANATVYAHGGGADHFVADGYHSIDGPVSLELRNGRGHMRTTFTPASSAMLAASLLAVMPDEIDRDDADEFLDRLHRPTGPGGPDQR